MQSTKYKIGIIILSVGITTVWMGNCQPAETQKPNILIIYADDLGYGDVACYNPASKVPTPNLDLLAGDGMRFTDAHSPSTVCTPSRYGIMTGRMPFRLNYKGVFTGVEGPCLISRDRLTLPEMLQQRGYSTAMFGKWHIGMTFLDKDGLPVYETSEKIGIELVRQVDFSRPIKDGPLNHGFDQFFGTVCCPTTDWIYAYIDGDKVPNPPTKVRDRSHIPVTPYSRDFRAGLVAPDFDFEEVDMVFLEKSKNFISEHVRKQSDKPFFLFHSAQAVHLPSIPGKAFKGKTDAGPHGDFIFEFDYIVGELLKTIKELGIEDNTLVIVSSDNGPEVTTSCNMRITYEHDGARPWRGVKRDQWEGGHRVPFIVKWPGKVKAGSISTQTISQTDIMHTCAAITGFDLPDNSAEDSYNILPILFNKDKGKAIRPYTLHQTISLALAIRKGKWKYLDHKGSGGNNYGRRKCLQDYKNIEETCPDAPGQLYNLEEDPGETTNLYNQHPEIVKELKGLLEASKKSGHSRLIESKAKSNQQPNIILIYADDLGRGMLSAWGQQYFTTPNIDKLAERGMRFNNAYGCQFCAPARASLLTGMHDCHAFDKNWVLTKSTIHRREAREIDMRKISETIHKVAPVRDGEVYLGTVARNAGYNTATFGKLSWGFSTTPERVLSHGWDYHFGYYDHGLCHGFYPPFLYENGNVIEIEGNTHIDCAKAPADETPENYKKRWDFTGKKQYSENVIVDKMMKYLEANNPNKTGKPFFIYFPSQLPHGPIQVPEIDPELKDNPDLTSYEKEYATMVKILDKSVGKIYTKCEELGILDNTILIFTGDNGHEVYAIEKGRTSNSKEMLDGSEYDNIKSKFYSEIGNDVFDGNDGMAGLKRDNWEGGVRVPLIWYWKGKIETGSSNQLVNNYDILNTVAELIGTSQYADKDSYSYAQTLLKGKRKEKEHTVFSSKLGPAIVTKDGWKLRYQMKDDVFQLYFLPEDYREEKVLNTQYPERVKELKTILLKECDGDFVNGGYPKFAHTDNL